MAAISKEEYLKRYLSSDAGTEKKKKRRKIKAANQTNVRIIDDDIDMKAIETHGPSEGPNGSDDEAPVVAEFIDERPEHVKRLEAYRKDHRWRVVGGNTVPDDLASKDYGVISESSKPVRKQVHGRSKRHDSDSDVSPPRPRNLHDSDTSPPRLKKRHDSDSDASPVRSKRQDSDSPSPKRTRHDSDSDKGSAIKGQGSQKSKTKNRSADVLETKKTVKNNRERHDSDCDQSPPRAGDGDLSPPRNIAKGSTETFSRLSRKGSDSDQSPPRNQRCNHDGDQSPPRRRRQNSDPPPPRRKREESSQIPTKMKDDDRSPPRRPDKDGCKKDARPEKTLGGAKAGLSSASEMRKEAEKLKQKENEIFAKIASEDLGREAKTVFRDKSGKRRDLGAEKEVDEEEAKRKAEEDKKYQAWGQGLKQRELKEQTMADYVHEASKPLARYKDDNDLDRLMREMDREGDPMAMFLKKKKKEDSPNERPRYKGPLPPPNRFGIMPGYRWDGVDRSNGFEKQIFSKMSEKKAVKEHAYKWSTEDM